VLRVFHYMVLRFTLTVHSWVFMVPDRRTDWQIHRYDEVNSRFSKCCKRAKKCVSSEVRTEVSSTNIQLNLNLQISDLEMITTNFWSYEISDWSTNCLIHWLTDWLADLFTYWINDRLTDWLTPLLFRQDGIFQWQLTKSLLIKN